MKAMTAVAHNEFHCLKWVGQLCVGLFSHDKQAAWKPLTAGCTPVLCDCISWAGKEKWVHQGDTQEDETESLPGPAPWGTASAAGTRCLHGTTGSLSLALPC